MRASRATAWCAVVLAGCAGARLPRVPGDPPPADADPAREAAYQQVLERHTRHAAIYDGFDSRAFVYATLQAPAFVEARLERRAAFQSATAAELATARAAEETRLADATELVFAVHVNDSRFDDFDRPNSLWRLSLKAGAAELAPLSIERLGRTTVELRSIYTYLESFWVVYRLRFPRVDPQGPLALEVASAVGKAELTFGGE